MCEQCTFCQIWSHVMMMEENDYIRMMEENGLEETTREVYEQAIADVPPSQEKKYWRRHVYLWINYAIYEEVVAKILIILGLCTRCVLSWSLISSLHLLKFGLCLQNLK